MNYFICVVTIFTLLFPVFSYGKISTDVINSKKNWVFVDRYCFISQVGKLDYVFEYPASYGVQNMYLYYDTADQWPAVYKSGKTCAEKEAVLRPDHYQLIRLEVSASKSDCNIVFKGNIQWIRCDGYRQFISSRDRWWYIAIGNCNSTQGVYLDYYLTMTNGESGDFWHYHFSGDEFDILPVDIGFLVLDSCTLVVSVAIAVVLKARQMLHTTFNIYLASICLECLSLLFDCITYGDYAQNGVGLPLLKLLGQLARAATKITFLLLLLLMAKGYTITRGRLSRKGEFRLSCFFISYVLMFAALFIIQIKWIDPGEVVYLHETVPGYILCLLRLVGWLWFCRSVYFTLIHYPEKRPFYMVFSAAFSLWFWLGPVVVVCANFFIGKWMREKIVNGVENAICVLGFWVFLFLTRPSAANRNFPYHVRTTQITAFNEKAEDPNDSVPFPHHRYAPDYDIFTVRSHMSRDSYETGTDDEMEHDDHHPKRMSEMQTLNRQELELNGHLMNDFTDSGYKQVPMNE